MVSAAFALHPNIYSLYTVTEYTVRVCGSVGADPGYQYLNFGIYTKRDLKQPQNASNYCDRNLFLRR